MHYILTLNSGMVLKPVPAHALVLYEIKLVKAKAGQVRERERPRVTQEER